jgi:Domain of unknown function (DUF4279)
MLFDEDDDPACKRTCAMLLVSGDNIDPQEFTRLFGVAPTETAKAGDCNGWRLSSEGLVQSTNAEHHIHWLLDQIGDKKQVISDLKRRGCQIDLGCEWQGHPESDATGPFLTPETLRRVADFDLNLIFYFQR